MGTQFEFLVGLDYDNFRRGYYIYMLALWMPFAELSRMIMRYGKLRVPLYLNIHSIMMVTLSLLTGLYVTVYYAIFGLERSSNLKSLQTGTTLSLLCILILQVTTGVLSRVSLFLGFYQAVLFYLRGVHKWLGYFTLLLSRVIVSVVFLEQAATKKISNPLMVGWFLVLGGFYFFLIMGEFLYRSVVPVFMKRSMKENKGIPTEIREDSIYASIATLINKGESTENILMRYPEARYVIVNNCLYELEDFVHPGGQSVIEELLGQEVNYFLAGAHPTPGTPLRHNHSLYVYKYLKNKMALRLKIPDLLEKRDVFEEGENLFNIQKATQFGESLTGLFEFRCSNTVIKTTHTHLRDFGRYLMVEALTEETQNTQRPYSILLCITHQSTRYRRFLTNLTLSRKQRLQIQPTEFSPVSETIPLIIKCYSDGKMSNIIKNIPDTGYLVSGPYGKGLLLDEKVAGEVVVITGGTGILPFLDLFDYMLKYHLLEELTELHGQSQAQRLNPLAINYGIVKGIRVNLYASFTCGEQFYGQQIIKQLYSLSQRKGNYVFDVEVRLSSNELLDPNLYAEGEPTAIKVKRSRLSEPTMKRILKNNPTRVYICGPPHMNRELSEMYVEMGGDERRLFVL